MSVLTVEGLTVAFAGAPIVLDARFTIARGETLALVGESGSGKSVTALAIMGLLPPHVRRTAGVIRLEGADIAGAGEAALRRLRGARMGMIFQEPMTSLNPVLTIGRQMTEALAVHRSLAPAEARGRAVDMLARAGIPEPALRIGQYPHEFSGGMRQRVMIAMTMALEPALLIADEPTTALDVTIQAQILDLMRALARDVGTSLLLITHDMGVVAAMADRVAVMRRGEIVETAAVGPLFARPADPYTRALLAAVPRLDAALRDLPSARPDPVLEFRDVGRSFAGGGVLRRAAGTRALDGVSLAVEPGETLALVGESGSGKSTLGRVGTRLDLGHEGRVSLEGVDITDLRGGALRRMRAKVQMIFQDPFASLDPRFTTLATLAEPLGIHRGLRGPALREEAAALLARVGLPEAALDRLPHEFSGGQRQRIAIARALAAGPRVIVADEPTSALDVSIQASVLALLRRLQEETGVGYLFITHDLGVVRQVAHRVAVMRAGRIVELGAAGRVLDTPAHPYTRALLAAVPAPDPAARRTAHVPPPPLGAAAPLARVAADHWVAA